MLRDISRLSQFEFDLLVIGGGINGAAIANIAARHGLTVALLEKGDFAAGTSSKSTKLIHGGIRYLENFEFDLVREALRERYVQLHSVPHLVKMISFIIPVYETDRRPLWMMKLGVFLYDFLSGRYRINRRRYLSAGEIKQMVPSINPQGLIGGVLYHDAQMDDARLCLENVLSAAEAGAQVANYVEVTSFLKERGRTTGVHAVDIVTQKEFIVRAKRTICAVGPWSNQLLQMDNPDAPSRIRTTKGIHIVYQERFCEDALLIASRADNRVFFIIPWKGASLIGTTDTDYNGSPDRVGTEEDDIRYLFREAARVFPGVRFTDDKIITTFAGLRPLVNKKGKPSEISRKHVIEESESGIVFVMGGKYTTYRAIAEECLSRFITISHAEDYPLYGSGDFQEAVAQAAVEFGVPEETVQALRAQYGTRYRDVLLLTRREPALKERLCTCSSAIAAQAVYAIEREMARTLEDIVWRRLSIGFLSCSSFQCRQEIKKILSRYIENGN